MNKWIFKLFQIHDVNNNITIDFPYQAKYTLQTTFLFSIFMFYSYSRTHKKLTLYSCSRDLNFSQSTANVWMRGKWRPPNRVPVPCVDLLLSLGSTKSMHGNKALPHKGWYGPSIHTSLWDHLAINAESSIIYTR